MIIVNNANKHPAPYNPIPTPNPSTIYVHPNVLIIHAVCLMNSFGF